MKKLFLYVVIFITMPIMAIPPKKAAAIWLLLDPIENRSDSPNNDSVIIKCSIDKTHVEPSPYFPDEHFWIIEIENNSNRDIYIDLQKSFILTAGIAEPMYIQKSVSNSKTDVTGVGVNLGIVSIGDANSSSVTENTFSQRIVIVPSDTYKKLKFPVFYENDYYFRGMQGKIHSFYHYDFLFKEYQYQSRIKEVTDIYRGQVKCYHRDNTIMQFGIRLNYSYDEELSNIITNKQMFYVSYMVGSRLFISNGDSMEQDMVFKAIPDIYYNYKNSGRIIRLWID